MNASSRYWQICRLSLANNRGYERREILLAKFWLETASLQSPSQKHINTTLLSLFKNNSALAGLCLRCYVSYPILKACQKLAALFGGNYNLSYRDLLPFVLDDDGKQEIVLAQDGKTQLIVDSNGEKPTQYNLFTVDVLASYKSDDSSMSLDNWTFLQTKQHSELKKFLAQFGFQHLSDWAMLNRIGVKQLSQLSAEDRHLVEVFHQVYRRDRRQQTGKARGKCPNPTANQLKEMQDKLQGRNCKFSSIESIEAALKRVANQLREYDIWSHRESLEVYEPDTGDYTLRRDLPTDNSNEVFATEEQELLAFIQDTLNQTLAEAIEYVGSTRIARLNKSKKYRPFANKFITGLHLYYSEGMSLKEIAPILQFGSWDQARRVLNPGDFLNSVRTQTLQQLLEVILQKTKDLGLTEANPSPDYLQNLSIQIETFADEAVFQAAAAEIKAGKNRNFQSLYAEQVRLYCQKLLNPKTAEQ